MKVLMLFAFLALLLWLADATDCPTEEVVDGSFCPQDGTVVTGASNFVVEERHTVKCPAPGVTINLNAPLLMMLLMAAMTLSVTKGVH